MMPAATQEQLEAYPPPADLAPLQMVRRALVHSVQARHYAAVAGRMDRAAPKDAPLARCAAHLPPPPMPTTHLPSAPC